MDKIQDVNFFAAIFVANGDIDWVDPAKYALETRERKAQIQIELLKQRHKAILRNVTSIAKAKYSEIIGAANAEYDKRVTQEVARISENADWRSCKISFLPSVPPPNFSSFSADIATRHDPSASTNTSEELQDVSAPLTLQEFRRYASYDGMFPLPPLPAPFQAIADDILRRAKTLIYKLILAMAAKQADLLKIQAEQLKPYEDALERMRMLPGDGGTSDVGNTGPIGDGAESGSVIDRSRDPRIVGDPVNQWIKPNSLTREEEEKWFDDMMGDLHKANKSGEIDNPHFAQAIDQFVAYSNETLILQDLESSNKEENQKKRDKKKYDSELEN